MNPAPPETSDLFIAVPLKIAHRHVTGRSREPRDLMEVIPFGASQAGNLACKDLFRRPAIRKFRTTWA
jgi:hypothetical protein